MRDSHWSFDYFHDTDRDTLSSIHIRRKPEFRELLQHFRRDAYDIDQTRVSWRAEYATLFNFSLAYEKPADGVPPDLRAGRLVVGKAPRDGGGAAYTIEFADGTTGEEGVAAFACDASHGVAGPWRLSVRNNAGGLYDAYELRGRLSPRDGGARAVELSLCDAPFIETGEVPAGSCACTWAFFDPAVLRDIGNAVRGGSRLRSFTVLENLEHVRPQISISHLDEFTLDLDRTRIPLSGCVVRGRGVPPTYFWVDDHGHVVIVSSIYTTRVLQRVSAGGIP